MLKSTDSCTNSTHAQRQCQHRALSTQAALAGRSVKDTTLMPVHRRLLGLSAFFRRVWVPSPALELHFKYGGGAGRSRLSQKAQL